jgi:NAD dependent epimerase/dehydratase family enzyme
MKIVLAGATGFIGKALRERLLSAGHELIVLTRRENSKPGFESGSGAASMGREAFVSWDGKNPGDWAAHLDGADAVINLSGENIAAKRWTPARKQKIVSSRVDATRAIVNAIAHAKQKPALLINASAVGYYGPCPRSSRKVDKDRPIPPTWRRDDKYWDGDAADLELTEASPRGPGFLAETCGVWESEARKAEPLGVRVILARLGPVLGDRGGMLSKMLPPFRFFMGAPLGTGRQWIPWVHRDDVAGAFLFMLEHRELSGPVNVTAPAPATMAGFCRELAKVLRRPLWFPVPSFILQRLMGEMAEIVLSSQKALPLRLLQAGYRFRHPDLAKALKAILQKRL